MGKRAVGFMAEEQKNDLERELEILVSKAGVVTFIVDGTTLTTATHSVSAYTFVDKTDVTPFIHFIRENNSDDDNGSAIAISLLEFGLTSARK